MSHSQNPAQNSDLLVSSQVLEESSSRIKSYVDLSGLATDNYKALLGKPHEWKLPSPHQTWCRAIDCNFLEGVTVTDSCCPLQAGHAQTYICIPVPSTSTWRLYYQKLQLRHFAYISTDLLISGLSGSAFLCFVSVPFHYQPFPLSLSPAHGSIKRKVPLVWHSSVAR